MYETDVAYEEIKRKKKKLLWVLPTRSVKTLMLLKKLTKLKKTKKKENAQPKALKVLRFLPTFHFYVKNK